MRRMILEHLADGPLTFARLRELLGSPTGDCAITPPGAPHVVFWANMSEDFAQAIKDFKAAGDIAFEPILPTRDGAILYLLDGGGLSLPLAEPLVGVFTEPHWLPVLVRRACERPKEVEMVQ